MGATARNTNFIFQRMQILTPRRSFITWERMEEIGRVRVWVSVFLWCGSLILFEFSRPLKQNSLDLSRFISFFRAWCVHANLFYPYVSYENVWKHPNRNYAQIELAWFFFSRRFRNLRRFFWGRKRNLGNSDVDGNLDSAIFLRHYYYHHSWLGVTQCRIDIIFKKCINMNILSFE